MLISGGDSIFRGAATARERLPGSGFQHPVNELFLLLDRAEPPTRRIVSFAGGLAVNAGLLLVLTAIRFGGPSYLARETNSIALAAPQVESPRKRIRPRPAETAVPSRTDALPVLLQPVVEPEAPSTILISPPEAVPSREVAKPVVAPRPSADVITGSFAPSAPAHSLAAKRDLATAVSVGSFSQPSVAAVTGRAGNVQTGAFETTEGPSGTTTRAGRVADGGFGDVSGSARASPTQSQVPAKVGVSGFEAPQLEARVERISRIKTEPSFRSVEILAKPKPVYSEEGRRLRIEGEVWLEVLFRSDGTARVQRILRSLGYGLDENAERAAVQIRFRPAANGGSPIDQVATVRIQFQLAN